MLLHLQMYQLLNDHNNMTWLKISLFERAFHFDLLLGLAILGCELRLVKLKEVWFSD